MREEITREVFDHMVELAALELSESEAEYLRRELNNQLQAIHELERIPLDEAAGITSHGVPYTEAISPPLREDVWLAEQNVEDILSQAPQLAERYIVVPEIPHTDLS